MLRSLYPWSPDSLSREGLLSLLNSANQLERAAAAGDALPQLLRGRRLALLGGDPDCPAAQVFVQAATELGAHVTALRASNLGERATAELLGQLYDAIECQDVPDAELRRLGRDAGVPVFDGIGRPEHPLYRLAGTPPEDVRLRLLQALLASTLN